MPFSTQIIICNKIKQKRGLGSLARKWYMITEGRTTTKRKTSIHTRPLLQHSCWLAMHPIYQTLYIYIVLFSLLSVFSLSSFLEDLIKVLLIWIQLGLLLCKEQILPTNVKGNCRITGSQDRIGPQRSQSQHLSAGDQNPRVQNCEPRAGSTQKSH